MNTLKIKLYELDRRKDEFRFDYEEDVHHLLKEVEDLIDISPVKVTGMAFHSNGSYTVKGHLETVAILRCSRCLQPYEQPINVDFTDIFVPNDNEVLNKQEDENIHSIAGDEIDITSLVEEAILLQIPFVPICDEDCKGLCSVCGTNLNEHQCHCETTRIDPRLADLAKWFDQTEEK